MAETGIIDHLGATLDKAIRVSSVAELTGITQSKQFTPAVYVVYAGDTVPTSNTARGNAGTPQKITQRWQVVIAVRNTAKPISGARARDSAGPIISAVIAALAGFVPGKGLGALKRMSAPDPAYVPGFAYFPTQWTTEFYTQ